MSVNGILTGQNTQRVKPVTSNQYDSLSSEAKAADILYAITDDEPPSDVTYSKSQVDGLISNVQSDIASIHATGTTNATGSTIPSGTYFYLNNVLVRTIADIASSATFTLNVNYEEVTAGALNELVDLLSKKDDLTSIQVTGSINTTGSAISSGMYFYLNGVLVRATANIANGDSVASKYEAVTAGALNELKSALAPIDTMNGVAGQFLAQWLFGMYPKGGNIIVPITTGRTITLTSVQVYNDNGVWVDAGTFNIEINGVQRYLTVSVSGLSGLTAGKCYLCRVAGSAV